MARIYQGITGAINGKVGNVVGRFRLGTNVIAIYQPVVFNPQTVPQETNRQGFGLVSQLMSKCIGAVNWGLKAYKGQGSNRHKGITAPNKFMQLNKSILTGTYPNQSIDYSKVVFSKGGVVLPANPACSVSGANIVFSWTDNSGAAPKCLATDTMGYVAFNEQKSECVFVAVAAKREDATASFAYPNSWAGDNADMYIIFANADGTECSDSQYLGSMSL